MTRHRLAPLLLALAACAPPSPGGPARCEVPVTGTGGTRVFVVGHHVSLDDALGLDTFRSSFRRHAQAIAPCLAGRGETLVLFPEDSGLAAWFLGRRALLARHAATSGDAFNFLYAQEFRAADEYRRRFDGVSVARGLTLALSDRAWRAMDVTFGGLAAELGAWVVTSANLPPARRSEEAGEVALFREVDATGPAYVATSGEVANLALVYGPDGGLQATRRKAFLTDAEEQLLDLASGTLAEQAPVALPFVTLGVAISRDAFYPPFLQRLDDLGAELLVQPEAFGGWTQEELPGDWLPDVMTSAGWTATQRYPAFRHAAAPMLVGNLLDNVFDGQVWFTSKARPTDSPRGFVASTPRPGFDAIGPWSLEEPDAGAPLAARQAAARALGAALLPGGALAGRYRDSLLAVDVTFHGEGPAPAVLVTPGGLGQPSVEVAPSAAGHQRSPAVARGGGRLWAAWSDGREGTPRVRVASSDDEGLTWSPDEAVDPAGPGPQLRPALAWTADGPVVAWQAPSGGVEQVRLATRAGGAWTLAWVEPTGQAQWEPALAACGGLAAGCAGPVAVAWTDFRAGPAPAVRWRCLGGPASRALDDGQRGLPRLGASQLQPALLAQPGGAFTAAWLDYRGRDWAVWGRTGLACGAGPGPAQRLSPASATEVLAASPSLALGPGGAPVAAWDEVRDRRPFPSLGLARLEDGGWVGAPDALPGAGPRTHPSPVALGGALWLVAQDLGPGKSALSLLPAGGVALGAGVRLDDTGGAGNQLMRPRAAANPDGGAAVVLFEDDRSGWWRVRATRLPP